METLEQRYASVTKDLAKIYGEIMSSHIYIDGCPNPRGLNKNDIAIFNNALLLLLDMKEEYSQTFENRIILGTQIGNLAGDMLRLTEKVSKLVKHADSQYGPREELFINSFAKFMHIIYSAQDSADFVIKDFFVEGFGSLETQHGTREDQEFSGIVTVIGDAELLSQIPNKKIYYATELGRIIDSIAQGEKSLIVGTNYYYESNVLPSYTLASLDIKGKEHIRCCLKDDIIKKVVERFLEYAQKNGNRINDIPVEEIVKQISLVPQKTIRPQKPAGQPPVTG